jgi:hypothetical protein
MRHHADVGYVVANRSGVPIHSVPEWEKLAGPASKTHWRDGRSAKELAKSWISGEGPSSLQRLTDTREETAGLEIETVVAEAQVAFDNYPGGKRNHDLLVTGQCASGSIVIGIEAKADETFGQTIAEYRRDADALKASGQSTNAPERLKALLEEVGDISLERVPTFGDLRYQLFAGVAGTISAAGTDDLAAFIVHEFATPLTTEAKREANKQALAEFVGDVTGAVAPDGDWWLLGPFHLPSERWRHTPLFIGHLTTKGLPG